MIKYCWQFLYCTQVQKIQFLPCILFILLDKITLHFALGPIGIFILYCGVRLLFDMVHTHSFLCWRVARWCSGDILSIVWRVLKGNKTVSEVHGRRYWVTSDVTKRGVRKTIRQSGKEASKKIWSKENGTFFTGGCSKKRQVQRLLFNLGKTKWQNIFFIFLSQHCVSINFFFDQKSFQKVNLTKLTNSIKYWKWSDLLAQVL